MAFKFVVIYAFIAVASAGLLPVEVKTIAQPMLANAEDEYDPHPQYKFAYDVEDVISGDSKRQVEARDGDVVRGEYALNDADGFRRTVQYSADPVHGFNAVVHREPLMKALDYTPAVTTVMKTSALGYAASPVYSAPAPAITVTHH